MDIEKIRQKYVKNDETMAENNMNDVIYKLKVIFSNKIFIKNLKDARNNWLNISVDEVLKNILDFLENSPTIVV